MWCVCVYSIGALCCALRLPQHAFERLPTDKHPRASARQQQQSFAQQQHERFPCPCPCPCPRRLNAYFFGTLRVKWWRQLLALPNIKVTATAYRSKARLCAPPHESGLARTVAAARRADSPADAALAFSAASQAGQTLPATPALSQRPRHLVHVSRVRAATSTSGLSQENDLHLSAKARARITGSPFRSPAAMQRAAVEWNHRQRSRHAQGQSH